MIRENELAEEEALAKQAQEEYEREEQARALALRDKQNKLKEKQEEAEYLKRRAAAKKEALRQSLEEGDFSLPVKPGRTHHRRF